LRRLRASATKYGPNAREQLTQVGRLADVIIGTRFQAGNPVDHVVPADDDDATSNEGPIRRKAECILVRQHNILEEKPIVE
jgi:hypothetical protein